MGTCSAQEEPSNRSDIPRVTKERSHREQLIERELPVEHMAPAQPKLRLQVGWRQDFGGDDQGSNAGRVGIERSQGVVQEHVLCHVPRRAASSEWRVMRVNRCNVSALWREL